MAVAGRVAGAVPRPILGVMRSALLVLVVVVLPLGGVLACGGSGGGGGGTIDGGNRPTDAATVVDGPTGSDAGDGGGGAAAFLFAAEYAGGLSEYSVDPGTGALAALPGSPFDPGAFLYAVAANAAGTAIYTVDYRAAKVTAYSVAPGTGAVAAIAGGGVVTVGAMPISIAVDPLGRFVYVGHAFDSTADVPVAIDVLAIDPTSGALAAVEGSPFALGPSPDVLTPDPTGQVVYVTSSSGAGIDTLAVGSAGALTEAAGPRFGPSVFGGWLAFHPNGHVLYNARGALNAVGVDASGTLSTVPGSPFGGAAAADPGSISLAIDPRGRFAYAVDHQAGVFGYTIDATGDVVEPIAHGVPVAAGFAPYSVAVDPTGRFVYVATDDGGMVVIFAIDPATGALNAVTAPSVAITGSQPELVFVRPGARAR
jgi:6-phosphogluconolactonase